MTWLPALSAPDGRAITFRPVTDGDGEFLNRVYASTREEELAPVPWSGEEKDAFLRMQFSAQDMHYRTNYPTCEFAVILVGGVESGRLYLDDRGDRVSIVDIALLPEHRGHGVGGAVLAAILRKARASGVPVGLHVERSNPAISLYRRLGFALVADRGVYLEMEWRPGRGDGAEGGPT